MVTTFLITGRKRLYHELEAENTPESKEQSLCIRVMGVGADENIALRILSSSRTFKGYLDSSLRLKIS